MHLYKRNDAQPASAVMMVEVARRSLTRNTATHSRTLVRSVARGKQISIRATARGQLDDARLVVGLRAFPLRRC